ncbi:MAG: hypothetical protein LBQ00_08205 [Syntrophobacterales bacterium]|jgi:membrane-associated HD superfamily phosphohydrolase|nr:hypothetical protein [Syntrophobacterales bacterium]
MRKKGSTKDSKLSDVLIPDRESLEIAPEIPPPFKNENNPVVVDFLGQIIQEKEKIIQEKEKDELQRSREEHTLRKKYLQRVFLFVVIFVGLVLILVSLAGCKGISFYLSDAVLITLLTTTTANIIGVLLIAFNWLFPSGKKKL